MSSTAWIMLILVAALFSTGVQQEKTNERLKQIEQARAKPDTVYVMGRADSLTLKEWISRKALSDSLKGKL